MDTLLILRDTITDHVIKVVDTCQPCVQEAETNCKDIAIVAIICGTILIIAIAAMFTFHQWKKKEHEATKLCNIISNINTSERQKAEFKDRLLSFLEKNTSSIDSNESQYYIKVLRDLIKNDNIPDYTKGQTNIYGKRNKRI